MRFRRAATIAAAVSIVALGAAGQPRGVPFPPPTPEPRDVPYADAITLDVDASDVARGIFRVRERIPVAAVGPTTLLYPEWHPGKHAPRGAINLLSGIEIRGNGTLLPWRRDPVNVFAFHVDVPAGVNALDLTFQFVSPTQTNQGRVVVTREMLNLQWEVALLYPAGHYASRIRVVPSLTLPQGWSFAVALDGATTTGASTRFAETDLETLVDSPLFAGRYSRVVDLDPGAARPVRLNLFSDRPDQFATTDEQLDAHRNLVRQAYRLFGSQHYDHYDFLLALSDRMGGIGLEHHRSSENGADGGYFTDWERSASERDLLAHEMIHSWNGKFRRPADLWTPNYETPMRGSLLWVYEGLTQYYGEVLAARSGLWSPQQAREALALTAALYQHGELPLPEGAAPWTPYGALNPSRGNSTGNGDGISATCQPEPPRGWERRFEHSIIVVDREGNLVDEWEHLDPMFSQLPCGRGPHQIKISPYDPEKHVWIIDDQLHMIYRFTYDGTLEMSKGELGVRGRGPNTFDRPTDIAWLPDGTYFITDGYGGTRVAKFDANDNFVKDWGQAPKDPANPGPNEFNTVHSIAISADQRLFVVDRGHQRMQVFDTDGNFLDMWPLRSPHWPASTEAFVVNHFIDQDGFIWAGDGRTFRILKFDLDGNFLYSWGAGGPQPGRLGCSHGITTDQLGNLYLADCFAGRVQKFEPLPGADPDKIAGQILRTWDTWKPN